MNKPTLSLAELAHRIVLEKKFNKMIAEITAAMTATSRTLNEAGLPTGIDQSIVAASKEIQAAGEDVSDENVQAAMLMAALQKGGDISKVDATDVEAAMEQGVKEAKQPLRESGGLALQIIEGISLILGNAALVEAICRGIQKVTGKKLDPSKFTQSIRNGAGKIKKLAGWPMKVFGDGIAWIIKKMGGGETAQKMGQLTVKMVVVISLIAIGFVFFPIGGISILGVIMSITALIGKGFELKHLIDEMSEAMDEARGGKSYATSGGIV